MGEKREASFFHLSLIVYSITLMKVLMEYREINQNVIFSSCKKINAKGFTS